MAVTVSSKSASKAGAAKRQIAEAVQPTEDDIRILAYELYERRQAEGKPGDAATDWIEAERQLEES